MDKHIATVEFTDGVRRNVYVAANGRQYVIDADGDGDRVNGIWYIPPDEPEPTVIVMRGGCATKVEDARGAI